MDSKIRDTLKALERITENDGEQFESVSSLKDNFDITITEEKAPAFRSNQKAIFVKEPFDSKKCEQILDLLKFWYNSDIAKDYIYIIEENGKKYLKYSLSIFQSDIYYNIWDDLVNDYDINPNNYDEKELTNLMKSDEWRKCEVKVARDLIGIQLLDKLSKK